MEASNRGQNHPDKYFPKGFYELTMMYLVDEGGNPIPLGEKAKRRLNEMIEDVNGEA